MLCSWAIRVKGTVHKYRVIIFYVYFGLTVVGKHYYKIFTLKFLVILWHVFTLYKRWYYNYTKCLWESNWLLYQSGLNQRKSTSGNIHTLMHTYTHTYCKELIYMIADNKNSLKSTAQMVGKGRLKLSDTNWSRYL